MDENMATAAAAYARFIWYPIFFIFGIVTPLVGTYLWRDKDGHKASGFVWFGWTIRSITARFSLLFLQGNLGVLKNSLRLELLVEALRLMYKPKSKLRMYSPSQRLSPYLILRSIDQ